ncbi:MAG: aminotransferase class I/II-fold pyridoxal phosphate-dependent enzyme [Oscillospiraceae bacterium]|nr:aminotransferase class I/II-fold pyridoxal phosphate-dependent enzyme [Oscillospiraceae bacterium]MDD4413828.1 aminotransferase class I/II-fold pyridoxal phosphate-dependent enzyme [Oscillospiraceae bacterium]
MSYKVRLNSTLEGLKPSGIRRFFDIACEMDDVISLSIGEPDFSTPWHIREEGIKSLEKGKTWYSPNSGLMKLRECIADYTKKHKGISYDPISEILVTVGGSEAIDLGLRALVCPGDEVLIPEPSFVCYSPLTEMVGGIPVPIVTKAEKAFRLTPQALKAAITHKTRLLIMPFPNNPTGAVMRREHLEEIADIIRETGIFVLSDEIYGELTYGQQPHISFASIEGMQERTMLISGFSKAFAMTGWRLGYACGPKDLMKQVVKLHQYALMCAPTTAQYAAIEALKNGDPDVESMRAEYDVRRRYIVDRLCGMGLTCFEPEGAFYVFPSVAVTGLSSEEFSQRLLKEKSVAVVPGTAFGDSGEGFIRISYCYSLKHITEAMNRLEEFVKENRRA